MCTMYTCTIMYVHMYTRQPAHSHLSLTAAAIAVNRTQGVLIFIEMTETPVFF